MANTYVINSAAQSGNVVTIVGTVNGTSVAVQVNYSDALKAHTQGTWRTLLAAKMLAAVPTPMTQFPSGTTWTD